MKPPQFSKVMVGRGNWTGGQPARTQWGIFHVCFDEGAFWMSLQLVAGARGFVLLALKMCVYQSAAGGNNTQHKLDAVL